ncbi:MAG: peptidylprolyl isomerase [Gemmatimonadetes bacterium]|nr:peptidylprolyl isomerase [Gemmatimonadota bacterium]
MNVRSITRHFPLVLVLAVVVAGRPVLGQQLVDYVVAVVDNEIILYSDVVEAVKMYRMQQPEQEPEDLPGHILGNMIDTRVVLAYARRDSVRVPAEQINGAVRQIIDQYTEQLGSDEALEQLVTNSGMTMRDWNRLLRRQKEEELLQRKLEEERFGEVRVTGLEVGRYYETYYDSIPSNPVIMDLSHIMISSLPDPEVVASLNARTEEIRRRIADGEDFGEMARRYSEDLNSATNGGDLGFFARGTFMAEFEEAAFALEPGEISPPVRTDVGLHIIKLEERNEDQIRVRHILVQIPKTDEDDHRALETISILRQRILDGDETFSEAATKYSEDLASASEGGRIGEFMRDQLLPQYQAALDTISVNEMTEPIRVVDQDNISYHIMMLNDRSGGDKLTLDEHFQQITYLAKQAKWNRERERWLGDLRRELYIDERGLEPLP